MSSQTESIIISLFCNISQYRGNMCTKYFEMIWDYFFGKYSDKLGNYYIYKNFVIFS